MKARKRTVWLGSLVVLAAVVRSWPAGRRRPALQASAQAPWPSRQPAEPLDLDPVTDAMLREPAPGDWLMYRRTYDGWGYSPLDQIDRTNVGRLRLAWVWSMENGRNQPTPLVHDGVMFLANPYGVVQALDARTGSGLWEYRRELSRRVRGRRTRHAEFRAARQPPGAGHG